MEDCLKQQLRLVPCSPEMLSVSATYCPYYYTAVSRGTLVLQQGTGRREKVFLQTYFTKG